MSGFYEYFSDKDFEEGKKLLLETIENDRKSTSDVKRQGFLYELSQRKINTVEDLVELDYLYNNGKLRSYEEVSFRNSYLSTEDNRNNYDQIRHKRNIKYFLIPFFVSSTISIIVLHKFPLWPLLSPTIGLIAAFIGCIKGYDKNIKKAHEYYIPDNDPRVEDEKLKKKIAIAAGITSGITITKHAKKSVKSITNVDSWKEMK